MSKIKQHRSGLFIISCMAGILYCSWPLGPALNPAVAGKYQPSELAAPHQPYNWVFKYGDVAASLLVVILCWQLIKYINLKTVNYLYKYSLSFMIGFCFFASLAALCPIHCTASLKVCSDTITNWRTLVHVIGSVLGPVSLFGSLVCALLISKNWQLITLLVAYTILGVISFAGLFTPNTGPLIQNIFILVCSISIAFYSYFILEEILPK